LKLLYAGPVHVPGLVAADRRRMEAVHLKVIDHLIVSVQDTLSFLKASRIAGFLNSAGSAITRLDFIPLREVQ